LTAGITIRCYQEDDANALYAAARESTAEVYPWLPWCHAGYTLTEAQEWVKSRAILFKEAAEFDFAAVDGEGRYLGGCALNHINVVDRVANLGYWVRTSAAGRGVATEIVRQLAEFAFTRTNLERLEIICSVGNEASRRVAEKSGAVREGVLHGRVYLHDRPCDAVIYALLRSKWKSA
jgi:RimJ/RimL family protein N-acetyltransferase